MSLSLSPSLAAAAFLAFAAPALAQSGSSSGGALSTPIQVTSGTLVADGTEQTLASSTTANGIFWVQVDVSAMVDGDTVELRSYTKANSAGTERLAYFGSFSNTQPILIKISDEIRTVGDYKFTLKQTAGSNHTYPWGVFQR